MADVPSINLSTLASNALQASNLSAEQARRSIDVLIKQFTTDQILLASGNNQLSLPPTSLKGKLSSYQHYLLEYQPTQQRIVFLPDKLPAPQTLTLTSQQIRQLISAPPSQWLALTPPTPQFRVEVISDPNQPLKVKLQQLTVSASTSAEQRPGKTQQQGTNIAKGLTINLSGSVSQLVDLPKVTGSLAKGTLLNLQLLGQSGHWQIAITSTDNQKIASLPLSPRQAEPLLRVLLNALPLAVKPTQVKQLLSHNAPAMTRVPPPDISLPGLVYVTPGKSPGGGMNSGQLDYQTTPSPLATLSLNKNQAAVVKQFFQQVLASKSALAAVPDKPPVITTTDESPSLPVARQQIHDLLRHLQPQQQSISGLYNQLRQQLAAQSSTGETDFLSTELKRVTQQLEQALPNGQRQDHQKLQALLSAPALPVNPVQLVTSQPQQGWIAGLVTLLQISLSSRLMRQQPELGNRLSASLQHILSSHGESASSATTAKAPAMTQRNLEAFARLEQQQQVSKTLAKLLANHQGAKVASAEQQIQGQESLFYSLPGGPDQKKSPVELLIRREPEQNNKSKKNQKSAQHWHLTMKLEIGDSHGILAKARLKSHQLAIDFYTADGQTKNKVLAFLPLLKKRLAQLDIEVTHSRCQLGHIPDTLRQRPYQLFEARV